MWADYSDLDINQYLRMVQERGHIPGNPAARCRLLAIELAEGLSYGFFPADIPIPQAADLASPRPIEQRTFLERYFVERWQGSPPDFSLMQISGYLVPSQRFGFYTITRAALDLLDRQIASAVKVFISYRRQESSAFALLIYERLRNVGVDIFLDMEKLTLGQNWLEEIEHNIRSRQYFIIVLGPTTLQSEFVRKEIEFAALSDCQVIPIWHNGFRFTPQPGLLEKIPLTYRKLLGDTHTLIVEHENPAQYDYIIQRLFRYFDIAT